MPLSLNDDEYNAVQAAAAPIHPLQRAAFSKPWRSSWSAIPSLALPSAEKPGLVARTNDKRQGDGGPSRQRSV